MVTGSPWIDVQFLKNAMEQLIECRRVLKYTYVSSSGGGGSGRSSE